MKVTELYTLGIDFYTEGPGVDAEGNLFCTTLTGGNILKIGNNKKLSVWSRSACPNGQVILLNGDHLVCDSKLGAIVRYNRDGVFLKNEIDRCCNGNRVFVPNDLVADKSGGFYFTDSIRHEGKIGYRSAGGKEYIMASGLDYPNGLALSKDESILYVAESYRNRVLSIRLDSPGISGRGPRLFAELPRHPSGKQELNLPDGIAVDTNHQLWVAHYGMHAVQVLNRDGLLRHTIEIPFPLVSNIFIDPASSQAIVTGGYAEPGPGAICKLAINIL